MDSWDGHATGWPGTMASVELNPLQAAQSQGVVGSSQERNEGTQDSNSLSPHGKSSNQSSLSPPNAGTSSNSAARHSSASATPRIQSCQFCRRRKIRCDKSMPSCMNCLKSKSTCVYPKRKGRSKNVSSSAVQAIGEMKSREEMLLTKIRALEKIVETLKAGEVGDEDAGAGEGEAENEGGVGSVSY